MTEKGKWRRKNLRVPIECVDHLWGFSAMFSSARLTSAWNFSAATGLRSKYQSSAASYSDAAAWRNSVGLLTMTELGSNPAAHFIPGNGLGLTGIKLLNAPSYFIVPSVLNRTLIHLFEAVDQRASKCGALVGRQCKRFFQQVIGFLSHARIVRQSWTVVQTE